VSYRGHGVVMARRSRRKAGARRGESGKAGNHACGMGEVLCCPARIRVPRCRRARAAGRHENVGGGAARSEGELLGLGSCLAGWAAGLG